MQTQEALKQRRSSRSFQAKPIERSIIEEIIDCARLAPSARNIQPWGFLVITEKEALQKLAAATDTGRFIAESACCIAVFCQDTKYYLEDGCAATENILIAATELGLASCWVAGDKKPYSEGVKELLHAPADLKLVSLIPLGYAKTPAHLPAKKSLRDVLHWDKF